MRRICPYILVFIAGAAVMVLELVGSRVLAPYFGATTIIWTSLIGIILASLAAGYWWGGRLADRRPEYRYLTVILMTSGVTIAVMAFSKEIVLTAISSGIHDIRLGAVVGATMLFALPSFLLASVSPFVIRVELDQLSNAGSTVGRLTACSTAGSILGTFLVGFVLLAQFGHFRILLGLAAVLAALSGLSYSLDPIRRLRIPGSALLVGLALLQVLDAPLPAEVKLDIDSRYSRIQVRENQDPNTQRPVRTVHTDIYGAQGGIFLDSDEDLAVDYQKFFRILHHYLPRADSLLVLGGGIFTYPRDFLARNPSGRVDVVEIDSAFITLARDKFRLVPDPRLRIHTEDARTFVEDGDSVYDAIFRVRHFFEPASQP
jgi:predicted membrane-bound spermidine synthase